MTPRVGFLGAGWIGRDRMAALIAAGAVEPVVVCDPSAEAVRSAQALGQGIAAAASLRDMLDLGLDGIVIATPSASHAVQAITALDAGVAVFCQKPLGRNAAEVDAVIGAARKADRLLGLDLSYRHTAGMQAIAGLLAERALGDVFAIDLTFHNAYGPDKPWFYDPAQSGGGCLIDLGVHLADLALWGLDFPPVDDVSAALFAGGTAVGPGAVEDFASARFRAGTTEVRLTCSWRLHAGRDAEIAARFYGTEGGAALTNVGGSFHDFVAHRFTGTSAAILHEGADDWGARAALVWAHGLGRSRAFDRDATQFARSADLLDRLYVAGGSRTMAPGDVSGTQDVAQA